MFIKKWKTTFKNSTFMFENLVLELQLTHGRGNTIPTLEIRIITMQKQQHQELCQEIFEN
jgi:hypothetical protein